MTEPNMPIETLEEKIGYQFKNKKLLSQALVHRSALQGTPHQFDNERLEFLGDRILNFCVSDLLFKTYRGESEGLLSRRHAALVRQDTLAHIARDIGLGPCLTLGRGEEATGGREKDSILSDAMEALIAALYLDMEKEEDLSTAWAFINSFWQPMLEMIEYRDPKSYLQEILQANGQPLPEYKVVKLMGEAHSRQFLVEVTTPAYGCATGEGSSKQNAQQEAARVLLAQLPEDVTNVKGNG